MRLCLSYSWSASALCAAWSGAPKQAQYSCTRKNHALVHTWCRCAQPRSKAAVSRGRMAQPGWPRRAQQACGMSETFRCYSCEYNKA